MKIPSLIALAGIAIGFAGPALAQQNAAGVDPAIIQQLENTISAKYNEAVDKHDAAAIAALYTEDAVFLTATGPLYGQKAIEKFYEDIFASWKPTNHKSHRDPNSFHVRFGYNVGRLMERDWSRAERRSYPNQGLLVRN